MGNEQTREIMMPLESDRSLGNDRRMGEGVEGVERMGTKNVTVRSVEEVQILKKNFDFRLKHREFLAHLYGFEVADNQIPNTPLHNLPCRSLTEIKIALHYQKVTFKFSDLYNVPIQQGAHLLIHCLNGFSILFDRFGYFTPESRLIFKQGQSWVVWVSDNIFSIMNQIEDKSQLNNTKAKYKFWQRIVHIFDILRDDENPYFSYTSYIYGDCQENNTLKDMQLGEILQKLYEIISPKPPTGSSHSVLRKSSVNSNSTIGKAYYKTNESFQENTNDATLSKFEKKTNQFSDNNTAITPKINKYPVKVIKNQQKEVEQHAQDMREKKTEEIHLPHNNQYQQRPSLLNFRRVSSKYLNYSNEGQQPREFDYQKHTKNISSISTLTNFTGRGNQIAPLRKFTNPNQFERCFMRKQKGKKIDSFYPSTPYHHHENLTLQQRKITQNSQGNQDSSSRDYQQNEQHETSMISNSHDPDEVIYFRPPRQYNQREKSNRTPSISNNFPNPQENMKDIQDYLSFNLKGEHKRSLTDQVPMEQPKRKIKLCLSQEFDSQFCSRKDTPLSSQNTINNFESEKEIKKQLNSEINISIETSSDRNSNHFRKVNFSEQKSNTKAVKDSIMEHSGIQDMSSGNKEVSMTRLANFKSEGGLKSLLGTKMDTLKSIKEIDVDIPMDDQILSDLNKLFPRHHFAKSTKMTK